MLAMIVILNALMGLPSVVVGLVELEGEDRVVGIRLPRGGQAWQQLVGIRRIDGDQRLVDRGVDLGLGGNSQLVEQLEDEAEAAF